MISVEITIQAPLKLVWGSWTNPMHIIKWNFVSNDWHCPRASNDLQVGGAFNWRMETKNGSVGFDFEGTYTVIVVNKRIEFELSDGRKAKIEFSESETGGVFVCESFEPEGSNNDELQRAGWQAILLNFKQHVESLV